MTQPFDYTLNVIDPVQAMQSGMAFGQQQRAGEQSMALNANADQRAQTAFAQDTTLFNQAQEDRVASQAAQRAMNADLASLAERIASGNYSSQDFAAMAAKYPDLTDEMSKMWEGQTKERKDADVASLFKGVTAIKAGRPDLAVQMLEERAVAAENAGDQMEADIARATAAAIKADPAAGMTSLGLLLQSVDPDAALQVFGEGRRVQSSNAYANGTTVTVFSDGTKEVTDAAGTVISGPEAQAAVDAAMASEAGMRGANAAAATAGKLTTEADLGTMAEAAKEAGKQAVVKSGEAFDALGKVRSNIVTIDTAVAALDAGANTGIVAKYFPDVSSASASLSNAMNRLGLDVISSVTFGALSEAEMKLAMETAVPRNLSEPDLRAWLLSKKAAQEKAAEALYNAAVYLGKPGNTLATWLEQNPPKATPVDGSGSQTGGQSSLDDLLREVEGLGQ